MKANTAMVTLLKSVDLKAHLTPTLMEIAQKGFEFRDECYVLRAFVAKSLNILRSSFPDRTGYECFVNSLHIEDYAAKTPLAQAILLLRGLFDTWRTIMPTDVLVGIVSADEFSVVVKVHLRRPAEAWLGANLDAYENAIMSFESSDDVFCEIAGNLAAS